MHICQSMFLFNERDTQEQLNYTLLFMYNNCRNLIFKCACVFLIKLICCLLLSIIQMVTQRDMSKFPPCRNCRRGTLNSLCFFLTALNHCIVHHIHEYAVPIQESTDSFEYFQIIHSDCRNS